MAVVAMGMGLTVYLFIRGSDTTYLAQHLHLPLWPIPVKSSAVLREWSGSVPSWSHAFAFSLLTAVLAWPRRPGTACIVWGCIDTAFEVLQSAGWYSTADVSADGFAATMVRAYVVNGTFDWVDVASIWLGAAMAYAAWSRVQPLWKV